jgi:hypothetical protein
VEGSILRDRVVNTAVTHRPAESHSNDPRRTGVDRRAADHSGQGALFGIVGSMVMGSVFILGGATMLAMTDWIFYAFAASRDSAPS